MCPNEAYNLAIENGPSKELEPFIARDYWCSLDYSRAVLKRRFILGEAAIARHALTSYIYATDVLNGPFPAGEAAIADLIVHKTHSDVHKTYLDKSLALDYQFRFNRDICSKEYLSQFPAYALSYAIMKNCRFPFGEPAMKKSPRIWKKYQELIDDTRKSV